MIGPAWRPASFLRRSGFRDNREVGEGPAAGLLPAGTVTFLMTDIEASTRGWERGPEQMRVALELHDGIMNRLISEHHGHVLVDRGEGDSFFAVFSRPSDAVSAALAVQRALAMEAWPGEVPLLVRMAIHTGEVAGDFRGPEVDRCARLRALGPAARCLYPT